MDLGSYGGTVLSAYGAALVLIGVLVVGTLWRGARVRRLLADVEARQGSHAD